VEFVEYTVDGAVAIVTLKRPPMNALNGSVIAELAESFANAADDNVRALVITGTPHFAAGADIAGFQASFDAGDQDRQASGLTEAVAALEALEKPTIAAITGYALGGVAPEIMGAGPIPAIKRLLAKTGLSVGDFDVIESNEAFASQACSVTKALGLDPAKVNPNGGAVALGHPVGATGAILIVKLMAELERTNGRYGLATMCIGGGQGIAVAIERIA
jgi:acetyl-CoA acetyltransferase